MWILKPRDEVEQAKAEKRLLKRQDARAKKLKEMGIDYDFAAGYVRPLFEQIVLFKPDRRFRVSLRRRNQHQWSVNCREVSKRSISASFR